MATMQEVVNDLCDDFTSDIEDAKTKTRDDTEESLATALTSHVHGFLTRHEPIPVDKDDVYRMVQVWACGPNLTSMARRKGYRTGRDYHPDTFDVSDMDEYCSEVVSQVHENQMQYSPWEFFAHDLNESMDPDAAWEAFDRGIMAGARATWRQARA